MDITFKLNNLSKKNDVQLNKEMDRRGLRYGGKTKNDKICEIIAYDAYNAGQQAAKKAVGNIHCIKLNGTPIKIAPKNQPERANVILTCQGESNAYLKVTEDQKKLLKWLIGNDWMCDTTMREVSGIEWVEP